MRAKSLLRMGFLSMLAAAAALSASNSFAAGAQRVADGNEGGEHHEDRAIDGFVDFGQRNGADDDHHERGCEKGDRDRDQTAAGRDHGGGEYDDRQKRATLYAKQNLPLRQRQQRKFLQDLRQVLAAAL